MVTGLVQEFQFGMNWSAYSRFVGDVFGAPLAMEGLAAFFLESTFLGLWIFGWNVLPRRVHLATIWLVAIGASLSAAFIMAANSWMQHPVGYTTDEEPDGRSSSSIGDVFTNPVFIWGYIHVLLASLVTGAVVMLAVSAWHLRRRPTARCSGELGHARDRRAGAHVDPDPPGRQPPGRGRDDLPADEDRGRRGAVGDLPALLVLAVPDRRRQRRDPTPDRRSSRFHTCCPCWPPAPGTAR